MTLRIKLISILLSIVFLLPLLLAGCTDKGSEGENTGAAASESGSDATGTSSGGDEPGREVCKQHTPSEGGTYCTVCHEILKKDVKDYKNMIYFACDDKTLTDAYKVAVSDVSGNVKNYKAGVLTKSAKCLMAGADYDTPWTRDTSINVWNAFALLDRDVSKNTLLSVIAKKGDGYIIDGQYWDAVIWGIGAYQYIVVSGDTDFIKIAESALSNSLKKYEKEEYDKKDGLFRGAAVYGDGVAAYPDQYANSGSSGIESWVNMPENKGKVSRSGVGLPMKALSTNCVYYEAYVTLAKFQQMLGKDSADALSKADALKIAINKAFWNEEKGTYDYLAYECDYQEALGVAYVLLFGIADERQTALVLENTEITEHGIACVYPAFDRYLSLDGYGRHCGTIWPHAQGFWARAAFENGYIYEFENELRLLAEKAVRDNQFYEIYHPDTGEVYGGLQEGGHNDIFLWGSCAHQTWSATAYLSLIYYDILGASVESGKVTFKPYLPEGVNEASFSGFKVGNTTFEIIITRSGEGEKQVTVETGGEGTVRLLLTSN